MLPRRISNKRVSLKSNRLSSGNRPSHAFFSSSPVLQDYADTIQNLKIGNHTRVIYQGFTGKQATANAKQSIEWGTKIVGGVRPGSTGEHLGLPVLPSVRAAKEQLNPDATAIFVAANQAAAAIEEAIEAEIPLIVAVAEHVPLHDVMRIHSILSTQSKSRLVGANAPGIISAIGKCRIGFQPLPTFSPGHVGIVAKSGTLSYEATASLTRAGLGQSLCIGMGGDIIAGTNFVDALRVFETDEDTEAIILIGELGGTAEEEAADWIKDYKKRTTNPKPIAAVIGGFQAAPGRVMGHAGAWTGIGEGTSESKYRALENAGVTMVDHPAKFGNVMKGLLSSGGRNVQQIQNSAASQSRGFHTSRTISRPRPSSAHSSVTSKRNLHITTTQAANLLEPYGITISPTTSAAPSSCFLGITVDRSARSPCIISSPTTDPSKLPHLARRFPFNWHTGPSQATILSTLSHLQLSAATPAVQSSAAALVYSLWDLYKSKEAISLTVHLSLSSSSDTLSIHDPSFTFDDAAFKSASRHPALHALRDLSAVPTAELTAESHGIVYIPLAPPAPPAPPAAPANLIGTLVNGAGLALNTLDCLCVRLPSSPPSNFLDTGGKATAATISASFSLVLSDPRVAVVFVNIFGGLTLCDMIAEGIVLAYKEVGVEVPVVVRLRGTNEELGREILEGSGLPIVPFDGFEEAVREVGRLLGEEKQDQ
ncbi:succinyl-CoA ligase-like protein subunit alpha [Lepidopterella palustris CBS 459.81]|uniref:Succinyl-CoA ligase-like protein subunit alpha n=1 Tax=Lepidopterella palustris CBS 459.81 TaxID=1314670 RepID=A0A8E2E207_9PEZI|nr:succinyl-CoA ligase-like protein subunit alpha [Lepidopterella palustris CBS 459.81]